MSSFRPSRVVTFLLDGVLYRYTSDRDLRTATADFCKTYMATAGDAWALTIMVAIHYKEQRYAFDVTQKDGALKVRRSKTSGTFASYVLEDVPER